LGNINGGTQAICVFVLLSLLIVNFAYAQFSTTQTMTSYGSIISFDTTRPLHTEGKYVKSDLGEIIYLRGVNRAYFASDCTGYWQPLGGGSQSGYGSWSETAMQEHLNEIKRLGFNTIRCQFSMKWWIDDSSTTLDGFQTNRNFRSCLEDTIAYASEIGLYVIIVPYSVVAKWPSPGQDPLPWAPYSITDPEGKVMPNRQAFVNFWVDVAAELKEYPNVLFELFNEPHGDATYKSQWFTGVQETITAIRAIQCDNIIVVHWGYCGSFSWINQYPLTGSNILYSNHIYHAENEGVGATIPTGMSSYEDIKNRLLSYWDYDEVINRSVPLYIGEFGAVHSDPVPFDFFKNLLSLMNDWGMSYTVWVWDQPTLSYNVQYDGTIPLTLNPCGELLVDAVSG